MSGRCRDLGGWGRGFLEEVVVLLVWLAEEDIVVAYEGAGWLDALGEF